MTPTTDELRALVERLERPSANETVMQSWDGIREMIASGNAGSLPRDIFESKLDLIDEERTEAAAALRLWIAERERFNHAYVIDSHGVVHRNVTIIFDAQRNDQ